MQQHYWKNQRIFSLTIIKDNVRYLDPQLMLDGGRHV